MLHHLPRKEICLEPHEHAGEIPLGGELQCIVPISNLIPSFNGFRQWRIGIRLTSLGWIREVKNLLKLERRDVLVVWMEFDELEF